MLIPDPLLKSPYPYFGGKSRIAAQVWQWLGDVPNFVDPFCGADWILLARPGYDPQRHTETINDKHGFIPNFWRAVRSDPAAVAHYAAWPAFECDLHARHAWLVGQKASLQARLEGDPDYYDAKIAGWWVWGMACWIGGGFCSGDGPWQVVDDQLVHLENTGQGVQRRRVHLSHAGQGVQRKRVHLGHTGQGVQRKRVHLGDAGHDDNPLMAWMQALSQRLRRVRVCCGDWTRVMGPSVTWHHGVTGVFLDPPYSGEVGRDTALYAEEDLAVAHAVREWCCAHGHDPLFRIVLCGYATEHDALMPYGWRTVTWQAHGGYGNQSQGRGRANRLRETCWVSPHCLHDTAQLALWEAGP